MTETPRPTPNNLDGYEVLLCLTGGIACYKSADVCSRLVRAGAGVNVAMTDASRELIGPATFRGLTRRSVYTGLWQDGGSDRSIRHISLVEQADLMVIAPATANVLGKLTAGIADDLVSTLAQAATEHCPILLAPAMNTSMWRAPAVQRNVRQLRQWGLETVGPEEGNLACGTRGPGRMSEPQQIVARIAELLHTKPPKCYKQMTP